MARNIIYAHQKNEATQKGSLWKIEGLGRTPKKRGSYQVMNLLVYFLMRTQ